MEAYNLGIVKKQFFNMIKESIFNDNLLLENKDRVNNLVKTIKSSPILNLENKVFRNLETKHIVNENLAIKYIDNNISLMKKYSSNDIIEENKKLSKFSNNSVINEDKKKLYTAIHNLIIESCDPTTIPDIDLIHESFNVVLEHIKNNKKEEQINETSYDDVVMKHFQPETLVSIALDKFNKKYSSLDENEKKLLYTLATGSNDEKNKVFESLKKESLELLENIQDESLKPMISETVKKINLMGNDPLSLQKNTVELYELKKQLS